MVVKLDEIRDKGLVLDVPVSQQLVADVLAEAGQKQGFRATADGNLKATFHKVSGGVLLRGELSVAVTAPCKRCLDDVSRKLPVTFTLNLVPAKRAAAEEDEEAGMEDDDRGERGGSFDLEATDQEIFDGKKIDLDPILREQVLLALPMDVVCRESCLGMCAQCGQNLNEKKCSCEPQVKNPRFAALKNFKLN